MHIPHGTSRVSIVHNGIIENHVELRAELEAQGQNVATKTDSETIAQLVDLNLQRGMKPIEAAGAALRRLEGSYAVAMIFAGYSDLIVCAQHGAPLAVGFGQDEMFVGSDGLALVSLTRRITYLNDGEWAVVDLDGARFFNNNGAPVHREERLSGLADAVPDKNGFTHFMEKELNEHPSVIGRTLLQLIDPRTRSIALPNFAVDFTTIPRISISACGSAFYAGLVGRSWFESIANIPTDADVASEFRYRSPPMGAGGLGIVVSQSGETADTLAALKYMREKGQLSLAVVNVPESSIARTADAILETAAGPEVSVASTKAFTAQLVVLASLAIVAGRARRTISPSREAALTSALLGLPVQAEMVLACSDQIKALAFRIARARDVLYLGRGNCFPIAMEGALKLKEISYIHAEGYAAGEMKHGPIALIDREVPVVAIAPSGPLFEKTASNLQEAATRGGQVIVFSDAPGAAKLGHIAATTITLPTVDPFVAPILHAIAVQLLAYHVAVRKGTDVDQPRNLAKSVTVE